MLSREAATRAPATISSTGLSPCPPRNTTSAGLGAATVKLPAPGPVAALCAAPSPAAERVHNPGQEGVPGADGAHRPHPRGQAAPGALVTLRYRPLAATGDYGGADRHPSADVRRLQRRLLLVQVAAEQALQLAPA